MFFFFLFKKKMLFSSYFLLFKTKASLSHTSLHQHHQWFLGELLFPCWSSDKFKTENLQVQSAASRRIIKAWDPKCFFFLRFRQPQLSAVPLVTCADIHSHFENLKGTGLLNSKMLWKGLEPNSGKGRLGGKEIEMLKSLWRLPV